jgi:16S rRNA (cytidine1402-2'-O)-methyltransferase
MLFLIATPIGNLADLSARAISTIEACDYLLCEDTRHTRILLNHYNLKKPLKSYHLFNESSRTNEVISDLESGMTIGLVSDAGTPCIADPGYLLVSQCRASQIPVSPIPGPNAAIAALSVSGFDTNRFQFVGFLPKKPGKLKAMIQEMLDFSGTSVCYESPFRVKGTLKAIASLSPNRPLFIAREITKKFEEYYLGTAVELLPLWEDNPPKGEFVILTSPQILDAKAQRRKEIAEAKELRRAARFNPKEKNLTQRHRDTEEE